ncbi:cystathionine beta-lyase [Hoeflea sp.]|uniref:cystathionine beta-lyase n=1 Tax=Hoeflea sp. TaxID=1940281 RepID=UPI003B5210BF
MARNNNGSNLGVNTRLTHSGHDPQDFFGFVNPPVVHASTVLFPDAATMESRNQRYTYGTYGTPTTDALNGAINELEGSAGTVAVPSGLAAIVLPFMSALSAGDHLLAVDSIYAPTRNLCNGMLARFGIETTYYDPAIGADIESLMRPNTRLVHTESPGSNTFEMQDIPAIAEVAHAHGALVSMDNTWATPLFFKPLDHGVDISIHAATKYPAGHSDILIGTVSANEAAWPSLWKTFTMMGICAAPDDAYATLRGLRTMGVRLERHQQSALTIAHVLEDMPGVAKVLHPALESFPGHELWKRDFCGSSGIFSIVLDVQDPAKHRAKAHAFLDALEIFGLGYSWGGYESLAVPVNLSDRTVALPPSEGPVIRLQIGLEDHEDLLADIERGLEAAAAA